VIFPKERLSNLCLKITDGSHNPPKGIDFSEYLMFSSKNIDNDNITYESPRYLTKEDFELENRRTQVAPSDVLLTIVGTIGRCAVVPAEIPNICLQRSVAVLKPNHNKILSRFLMYSLMSMLEYLNSRARGVAQKGIYLETIRDLEITIPPISTQQQIVTKLDAIFAEISKATAAAETNAKNAEALFQSYLSNIFEHNASLTKKLKDCCLIKPPKKEARILNDSDMVSFMPMEALGINHKFAIPNQERKLSDVSGSYTYFAENDVLLAKITPCFENGKLGIAKDLTNRIGFGSSEYIVFRPNPDVDSSWLYYFLNRSVFRENGAKHMSGAVGHKRVTKEFIEDSLLPVPLIDKQKQLVADIENVLTFTKSLLSSSKNKVHELSILKNSILSKAFNGELVRE
jgi:type I restriction enzyme, S subunit